MSSPAPLRVLVADDHPLARDGLVRALMRDGRFDVVATAADGRAAVVLVEKLVPDCAVLDVRMPVLNGLQAMAAIRRRHPDVRVVLLSAFGDEALVRWALEAGASAYLTKAVDRRMICDAVAQAAGDRSPGVEPPEPPLTARERDLLRLVSDEWEDEVIAIVLGVPRDEVALRIQRLVHRLGAYDLAGALAAARRAGPLP